MISTAVLSVASQSLTPTICHVLVYCFGSFLLQDLFLSLQVCGICFKGTKYDIYCERVAYYIVKPSPAMIRTVYKQSRQIQSYHNYHICPPTFFFGDAIALFLESSRLVQRNSNVSCSYLIELMFLELDVQDFFTCDRHSSTSGFTFKSLRASLLTVVRVVYAIVLLSSGKTMVSILHVILISCRYF